MGVKAPVAVLGILAAGAMLWLDRVELAYFVSPRAPLTLGAEGDYRFEALASNRYAQVHGQPTRRGAYSVEQGNTFVVIGLRDTPLLVRRSALPGENWTPGGRPPQPNQTPFAVRGRLLRRAQASRFEQGFVQLMATEEVRPRDGQLWILIEGQRPGSDWKVLMTATALLAFAAINGWLLWKELAFRWGKERST